ncbi:hypothetical protein [Daejeonella sp.]|uniref:hypothetical protein n=1 Tax=Daejeonella sp. TaxID=2805397 RepID=UPI0025C5A628|nr:hypothetical protein [Daejeonella sp.]
MAITKFSIELIEGAPVFRDKGNIILLDTGAPKTIHTSTELFFLGKSFDVITTYGPINMQTISGNMGTPITTLLGMDIIKDYKIIFDYKNLEISLLTADEEDVQGEEIPMTEHLGIPVIDVLPIDKYIPMFLDSGAHLSYIKSDHTQDHKNFGQTEDFHPTIGKFTTTKFLISSRVGEHYIEVFYGNLPSQLVSFLSLIKGDNGILGYDFFAKFKICLDMKKMKLTILEGPHYY